MITLLCTKNVVMRRSNEIAFKAGQEYSFVMDCSGGISRYDVVTGHHSFRADVWTDFFKFELEKENA